MSFLSDMIILKLLLKFKSILPKLFLENHYFNYYSQPCTKEMFPNDFKHFKITPSHVLNRSS